ncbi:MAG: ATP-binding protein [Verrucomicrobiota bacterium]
MLTRREKKSTKKRPAELPTIHVTLSDAEFGIHDNCGGIDLNDAITEVFNFGHPIGWTSESLGVYGIGLKRALFKLGNHFEMVSQTRKNGFSCQLDVGEWVKKDESTDDWTIPITEQRPASSLGSAGTKIRVDRLHEEVRLRIKSGTVVSSLCRSISTTFSLFLERYVRIMVNGQRVEPSLIPTSRPSRGNISFERLTDDGVQIRILATLAKQGEDGRYDQTKSGWYVICNGRAVVTADKSEITGWGITPMPMYHTKFGGFVGLVFFESSDPMKMPWTTTKRSLNRESAIYLRARGKMAVAARPVLTFMNSRYGMDLDTTPIEREIARGTVEATPAQLATSTNTQFKVVRTSSKPKLTQRVQYDARISDLDKIRKHLNRHSMKVGAISEHTFNYFLDQEGLA